MNTYHIRSYKTGEPLFSGPYGNFNACLEAAAATQTPLAYADLRHRNLSNLMLDGIHLPHADFSYSNLTGANLSEARLPGALFHHTDLYNTCMAYADLSACNFEETNFGATDIVQSNISGATFSSLSCFSLDFNLVKDMQGCIFKTLHGAPARMSKPPIVIKGLHPNPLVFMDEIVAVGHRILRDSQPLHNAKSRKQARVN